MDKIPKRIPTRVADRSLAAMDSLFTPVIQLEMVFGHRLDAERLETAAVRLLEAEPLLGCRFVPAAIRPYWERIGPARVFATTTDSGQYEAFRQKKIDFSAGPQVSVFLHRAEKTDTLLLKVSHLVSDAAGVKEIAGTLSRIYNRLEQDPGFCPAPNSWTHRSFRQILRHVPWLARPGIVMNYLREAGASLRPYGTHRVPVREAPGSQGVFITRHIGPAAFSQMAAVAKAHGATLNDLLLTAIFRALSKTG